MFQSDRASIRLSSEESRSGAGNGTVPRHVGNNRTVMVLRWMQRCVWRFLIVGILSDFVPNRLGDFLDEAKIIREWAGKDSIWYADMAGRFLFV